MHQVSHAASFDNKACGFVRNNNPQLPSLTDCKVATNATDYCQLSCSPSARIATTGAQAKLMARNADGSLPAIP